MWKLKSSYERKKADDGRALLLLSIGCELETYVYLIKIVK